MIRSLAIHAAILSVLGASHASNGPWDPYQAVGVLDLPLPACCKPFPAGGRVPPVYADNLAVSQSWAPVVDLSGAPPAPGAPADAYYTGREPPKRPLPVHPGYRYLPEPDVAAATAVDLARSYTEVSAVRFHIFPSDAEGRLTDAGRAAVQRWLRLHYGDDAVVVELGEGGFSVAFRVCAPARPCVVVKVRKIAPCHTPGQLRAHLHLAVRDLRRDLAVAELATTVVARGWLVEPDGHRERLARVARFTDKALIRQGVLEQELVVFAASDGLKAMLARLRDDPKWRAQAVAEVAALPAATQDQATAFLERFEKPSRFGPDVIKVHDWVQACEGFARAPILGALCARARDDFRIPPDFLARLGALEQLYRDTAADVIRFSRVNIDDATGNGAMDGLVREVGLDFNHGRNAGWEPATRSFVLFDY